MCNHHFHDLGGKSFQNKPGVLKLKIVKKLKYILHLKVEKTLLVCYTFVTWKGTILLSG